MYLQYNSNKSHLNLNETSTDKIVVLPGRIYAGTPYPVSQYIVESGPRDTTTDYIIDRERLQHPDQFSRFDYSTYGGWSTGEQTRGYVEPLYCGDDPEPQGLAPERFYNTQ